MIHSGEDDEEEDDDEDGLEEEYSDEELESGFHGTSAYHVQLNVQNTTGVESKVLQ